MTAGAHQGDRVTFISYVLNNHLRLHYHLVGKELRINKNTRTLGEGDYPAFEFILKVHGKVNFLSFTRDQKFVARLAREAVP